MDAKSPEAQQKRQQFHDQMRAMQAAAGELKVAGLKVGAKGKPVSIDAKVMQVVDDKSMLVGLEDAHTNNGRYSTWVMLKVPTTGITDGAFWRGGQWKDFAGAEVFAVTGTTTYKTVDGGTKTVFVLFLLEATLASMLFNCLAAWPNRRFFRNPNPRAAILLIASAVESVRN